MTITVGQLATLVHGSVEGDGEQVVQAARILQEAQPGDITFLDKKNNGHLLQQSRATAAVVPLIGDFVGKALIRVADPLLAFITVFQRMQGKPQPKPSGIDARAHVDDGVCIGDDPSIHAGATIGGNTVIGKRCRIHAGVIIGKNCRIGDDVVLFPNVVLYDEAVLGDRVVIHANSTIGADGFGYRFQQGRHVKVPQLGNVVVGDDVEIGANAAIDRGTFGATTIGEGTKIDNFVQIGHNCRIGKHNAIAGQVGIAGSCTTGNFVYMGGQSGVADHLTLGDGVQLGAKTGVIADVPAGLRMFLYPAHEEHDAARIIACMKKLPAMRKDFLRVLKELNLQEKNTGPAVQGAEAA